MILWHLGATAAIVYVTLGRSRIDYRFILLGAVAPDAIDGLLWLVTDMSQRGLAHTLLAPVVVSVVVIGTLRGERRLAWFGLGVGWLLHLALDGMWSVPTLFFWPAFGFDLPLSAHGPMNLGRWVLEVLGALLLLWFWVAFRLGHEGRWRAWLKDGHLRA